MLKEKYFWWTFVALFTLCYTLNIVLCDSSVDNDNSEQLNTESDEQIHAEDPTVNSKDESSEPVKSGGRESLPGWLDDLLVWAAKEPLSFLYYVLLGLSPLFLVSAGLSWKLCKDIERKEQKRKKKMKKRD
eukprot:TRINITY_DN5632_c0_g1_i1.p1 TRINITY_DN5632_c0_g1~~TRINITY_DN5632_c0_g1_i1.p1  ORF type:complete len:131 (+),score=41.44 TRINITY_DN5632_c0_g1_i1:45-437(+)